MYKLMATSKEKFLKLLKLSFACKCTHILEHIMNNRANIGFN